MIKSGVFSLALSLCLLLMPGPSAAQGEVSSGVKDLNAMLSGQPALSQGEVDTFLKMVPELKNVGSDAAGFEALLERYKLSRQRYAYILSKVTTGVSLALKVPKDSFKDIPAAVPNDEEQKIIEKNKDQLIEAIRLLGS